MPTRAASQAAQRSAVTGRRRRRRVHHRARRISRLLAWLLAGWFGTAGLSLAQVAPGTLPAGGQIRVGSGQLTQSGNLLVVQQNTARLGLDWQSFNIGSAATVEFRQPGATSIALNRVLGNDASQIYGQLKANGQVFLVNPNGVLFAPGSRVDVGGLVASALDLSQQDFADGRFGFTTGGVTGAVVNRGSLRASSGGYLALFGQQVSNEGEISVDSGSVVLGSGRAATVSISGSGLISAVVAPGLLPGSVDNRGLIAADGGIVTLTARSAQDIAASLVNNSGIVRADTIQDRNGEIWITGDRVANSGVLSASSSGAGKAGRIGLLADLNSGHAQVGGEIQARSAGGDGGFVETSGARVDVAEGTRVDTRGGAGRNGTWLVDPTDFNIAPAGTPGANLSGQTLSNNLQQGNFTVASSSGTGGTAGNVNVDDTVTWSANKLTLNAAADVNIRQPLVASGSASLALQYGQATASGAGNRYAISGSGSVTLPSGAGVFSTKQGTGGATTSFTVVNSLAELAQANASSANLALNWALGSNLDASGQSFSPIGNAASSAATATDSFSGVLDGVGHTISNLTISLAAGQSAGLIANANNATIRNLTLSGGSVAMTQTGNGVTQYVGAVVGVANGSTSLDRVFSTASVSAAGSSGNVYVGGLVGATGTGTITASGVSGPLPVGVSVTGGYYTGGIVGYGGTGLISGSSAFVNLSGAGVNVGGLAGRAGGAVDASSSAGTVQTTGNAWVGGLVGYAAGAVTNSSSSAAVTAPNPGSYAGGLIGGAYGGNVTGASANGSVNGGARVGGLVGDFSPPGASATLRGTASGNVSGTGDIGGLVGYANGNATIASSSATGNVSNSNLGNGSVGGLVGSYNLSGAQTGNSASGTLNGGNFTGGLIGYYNSTAAIADGSYTGPAIVGGTWAGGLIGYMNQAAAITGPSQANPWTLSVDVSATAGSGGAGGFVGRSSGTMTNLRATGNVSGTFNVGGLVGYATGAGSITNSSATGNVTSSITANGSIGGLVGAYELSGAQTGNSASGTLTRGNATGGLIGWYNSAAPISDGTYTGASVTGGQWVGGLIGYMNQAAAITGPSPANPWVIATNVTATVTNGAAGGFVGRSSGTMANLKATGTIAGNYNVGGLVGYATGTGSITNSSASGNVGSSNTASGGVGGLVGAYELSGVQTGNSASGTPSGGSATGGLIGWYNSTAAITDGTYSGANVSGGQWVGGLVGYMNSAASISGASPASPWVIGTNVQATVNGGAAGGFVGRSLGPLANLKSTGTVQGVQDAGGIVGRAEGTGTASALTATGSISATNTNGGVGGVIGSYNLSGALTASSASGTVAGGTDAGGLVGYYNSPATIGDGSYSGASVSAATWAGGLIGYMNQAAAIAGPSAQNPLTVAATVTSGGNAGGLVGRSFGPVSNATASGSVTGTGGAVGGLVGQADGGGGFSNVSATGAVRGTNGSGSNGGLVGYYTNSGNVSGGTVSATGAVSGGQYAGGLIGRLSGSASVIGARAQGNVTGTWDAGGLIGNAQGSGALTDSTAVGNVTGVIGTASNGGLVGYFDMSGGQARNQAGGNVSGGAYTGGLIGYYNPTAPIVDGSATGTTVNGGSWTGGLIGYVAQASVSGVSSTANVTSTGNAGGLLGRSVGNVSSASASGSVSGSGNVGGLVGQADGSGSFSDVTASGAVSSSTGSASLGGLVGYANQVGMVRATATGAVSGGSNTGGLVGLFYNATLTGGRAQGNVSGSSNVGGLVGNAQGTGAIVDGRALGTVGNATNGGSVGGLVGYYNMSAGLLRGRADGSSVSGGANTGGLVGYYSSSGTLDSATVTTLAVSGSGNVGGVVGNGATLNVSGGTTSARVSGGGYAGGFVGYASGSGTIANVTVGVDVSGTNYVGGLAGWLDGQSLSGVHATGNVSGVADSIVAGGLVGNFGYYYTQSITNSSASGRVFVDARSGSAGGIVGRQYTGNISGSTASGAVVLQNSTNSGSSAQYAGGLAGEFYGNSITGSHATGAVTGLYYTGGLVGNFSSGSSGGNIAQSGATGLVSGSQVVGGLVGSYYGAGVVESSATGNVVASGTGYVGGLLGQAQFTSAGNTLFASGSVTATNSSGGTAAGGLIGQLNGFGLTSATASGRVSAASFNSVGGLIGLASSSTSSAVGAALSAVGATGDVSGSNYAGGLVGYYNASSYYGGILSGQASGNVTGGYAGGLVGQYSGGGASSQGVQNSTASGNVAGNAFAGGLVGYYSSSQGVSGSSATGAVTNRGVNTTTYLGGLVGYYYFSSASGATPLTTSYAAGNVTVAGGFTLNASANLYAGGLVGYLDSSTSTTVAASDVYASGKVALNNGTGQLNAGGLVGYANASVARGFANGAVSATNGTARQTGGLIGSLASGVTAADSFWNTETTGQAASAGGLGTGLTTAQSKQSASFTNWSINTTGSGGKTWRIYQGFTTPLLSGFLTPLTLTLADASKTYDGTTSFGNASIVAASGPVTHPERIVNSAPSADVGTYAIGAAGVYSVQNGYDLTVTGSANLTVTPRPLTLAGIVADKTYDGTRNATLVGTAQPTGLVAGEDLLVNTANVTALFDTKNVGTAKTVTVSGYTLANGQHGKASNYSLANAISTTANITQATLSAGSFSATNRAYNGTTLVAVSATGSTLSGVFGQDNVSVDLSTVTSGLIADKNVGSNKPVTVLGASLTGADAANYRIGGIDGVTVNITPKALTVNSLTANDRTYNAQTTVDINTASGLVSGVLGSDSVQLVSTTLSGGGQMADKNIGTSKPVTVTGALQLRGADAANYTAQAAPTTVNIGSATVYLYGTRTTTSDRVYDGTTNASLNIQLLDVFGTDKVVLSYDAPRFADKNVAFNASGTPTSKPILVNNAAISGTDAANYTLDTTYYAGYRYGTITPKPLTVTGVSAVTRAYDGTRNVTVNVSGASVDTTAVVPGDAVTAVLPNSGTVVGTIADKNVGNNKAVTVPGFSLTGVDQANYTLTGSNGVTVNITKKNLLAGYTGRDRSYDGQTWAGVVAASSDIVSGDDVRFYANEYAYYYTNNPYSYTPPAVFTDSKNVASNKPVKVTYDYLIGNDANNYNYLNPGLQGGYGTTTANLTAKPISLTYTGTNKVYDGTTGATVTLNKSASGIFASDNVTATQNAAFADPGGKNVGTGKTIAVSSIAISGTDAYNYTLSSTTSTASATITAKPVTFTGIAAVDRVYDGTTTVAVRASGVTSAGFVPGDDVSVVQPAGGLTSGTIADKNVGTAKPVTVTGLSLGGTSAGNYTIDISGSGITVNIAQRPLTVGYTGVNRPYNGGVAAQVTPSSTDIVGTDNIVFSQNAVYTGLDAKSAGTNKPISITGISIGGTDRANYALQNTTATAFADITSRPLTVSYTGVTRVYDGLADTSISVLGSTTDLVPGDLVSFAQSAQLHGDGSAGTGKLVDVTGITLAGPQAANYTLTGNTATTTATITQRPITVSGITATDRAYDGTRTVSINVANASVNTSAVVPADIGNVSVVLPPSGISTGTMADKSVGQNKDVQATGLSITGSASSNYTLGGASGLTVNITARQINALFSAASKVYDGTATAQVSGTSADILSGDVGALGISASGVFVAGKNAGTGKTVAVSGAFLTGAERNNYALVSSSGSATADITAKDITPTYGGGTRVYDGSVAAPVSSTTNGFVANDIVGLAQTAQFRDGKAVGGAKPIDISAISLVGADALNYHLVTRTATATGSVTAKPIFVSGLNAVSATDRIYDGTSTVQVTIPSNVTLVANSADIVSGDQVSISVPPSGVTTGTMANKNAGTGKQVVITGLNLSGSDAGNYVVAGAAGVTVNIAQKPVTAAYTGVTRAYDGGTSVAVTGSSGDILGTDSVTIGGSGLFVGAGAKNVGTGKAIQVTGASLGGTDSANYSLVNPTGGASGNVTVKLVTPSYAPITRVYDGTTSAPVVASRVAIVAGDDVGFGQTAVFVGAGAKNVGSGKTISVSGISLSGADAFNYALTSTTATTTGTIVQRPITLTGLTGVQAVDRAYDGTTSITINVTTSGPVAPAPGAILGSDVVVVNAPASGPTTGTIADKNVGSAKPVASIAGLGLSGTDAANYSIVGATGLLVNITPRLLTAVYTGSTKVYDGLATAPVTATSSGIVPGDALAINPTATFDAGKNVGSNLAITVSQASLSGGDRSNYTLLNPTGTATGGITPKPVSVSYAGGATRVYDGTTSAPVLGSIAGLITGDDVGFSQTAVFTNGKNVGTNKPVTITGIGLVGTDRANYALTATSASSTASVTPKPLRLQGLTGITATDRVYDGTATVQVTVATTGTVTPNPQDLVPGDAVGVTLPGSGSATGTMADKNVGTAKPVSVPGFGLTGTDSANYTVAAGSGITVNITPRPLNAVYGGVTRVYDGTADVVVTGTSVDILGTDQVTIGGSGRYSGPGAKNAGSSKPLDVLGASLSGTDRGNYSLVNATGTATGTVLQRTVTATFSGGTKVYDGSTAAPVAVSTQGLVQGDAVSVTEIAVFTDSDAKGVGTNKPVSISGIALAGTDAVNYSLLSATTTTTANVTPKPLGVTGLSGITATDRVYDGTNRVSISVQSSGPLSPVGTDLVPGDVVTVALPSGGVSAGTMADKNVGQNKPVTVAGLVLGGADGHNYQVAAASGVTVNIAPRPVTATYVALDKVYDGTAVAQVGGVSSDLIGTDQVTITGSGLFAAGKNAGTGKTVIVSRGALDGADLANYSLLNSSGTATASITRRLLTASYTGGSKVYDGLVTAPVTLGSIGIVGTDDVSVSQTAVFTGSDAKNVGSGKAVGITGIKLSGADAANYDLVATTAGATATVTQRPVSVSGLGNISAVDRVYDGTRNVQIVASSLNGSAGSSDFVAGDDVQVSVPSGGLGGGLMVDKNAGTNKSVAVVGLSLVGADARNYLITGTAGVTVNIAPKPVALLGLSAIDRVYDGTVQVGLNTSGVTIRGVIGTDDLQLPAAGLSGTMADKHAGAGKAVTASGLQLGGADAGNYTASSTQTLSVNIAQRPFTASIAAPDKVYDGTSAAAATLATDGLVKGDDVALAPGVVVSFADKNAGSGKTVTATGLKLAGADAADYALASATATTTASITPAPLTIRYTGGAGGSSTLTKVYGESVDLGHGAFAASGLIGQETVGQVDIASAGAAAGADASATPYAVTLSNARGGRFDPTNYSLSYATGGGLLVTPRPVYVAGNILVVYSTDIKQSLYDSLSAQGVGYRLLPGGLLNGDSLQSVALGIQPARPSDVTAGSVVTLAPSGATLGAGAKPGNYAFNYANGAMIVLPSPPRVGDATAGSGTSTSEFNLNDAGALETARQAEALQAKLVADLMRQLDARRPPASGPGAVGTDARPEDLTSLLAADPQRVSPALLKRVPLLSVDPQLQRAPAATDAR